MNFGQGPGIQLPKNFGNQGMNNSFNNNNFNNRGNFSAGINNSVASKVQPVKPADRTFKSIDGTTWGSFEEAANHNRKYYHEQETYKNGKY